MTVRLHFYTSGRIQVCAVNRKVIYIPATISSQGNRVWLNA